MLSSFLNKISQQKRKFIISLFAILHFTFPTFAQVYPIQLSTQLLPPYSGYLPDYGDPTNEKLKCILMLNDFSITHRDVKLEITITGNGYTIQTNPTFFPSPITIYPGVPEIITGIDLAPYLETQNLIFTGINVNDYEQRKVLPEGYYSICIKVIDYYQADYTVLSNASCTSAWFYLADPPFLNFPQCNSTITPTQPQNIFFQWTPMNLSSPNSVMNTEYLFELFEVRPASTPPNDIVLTTAPIFSITTSNSLYNYGIIDPLLYTGMQYVWRVRAIDLTGRDYFKNEGYSQICTFTYGNPQNTFGEDAFSLTLNGQASTHRQIKYWWNNIANFTEYKLQIRKTGTQNWFDYSSNTSEIKISPLEPSTSYEARVMGIGEEFESDWSNTVTVTTNPFPTIVCNDQNIPINALSAQPLLTATPNMIMKIGQFEMYVTSISPFGTNPGYYSGYGYIIYYFKKIGVQFDNVYINDNVEITNGNVVALTEGVDAWVDNWMLDEAIGDAEQIAGTITNIYLDEDSSIVVVNDLGDTTVLTFPPNDHPVVVQDDAGNQYIVYPDGTIVPGTYLEFSTDTIEATKNNQIVFEKSNEQTYGFDAFQHGEWHNDYEVIQLSDETKYFIPNKSIEKNKTDIVRAKINAELYSTGVIQFKNQLGTSISHSVINDSVFEITLPASQEDYSVYAFAGNLKLGKLNVKVYEKKNEKVVLVALGNQNLPNENDVENYLNTVYKSGIVSWEVSTANALTISNWDENANGKIDIDDYSLLNKYSGEMDNIRNNFDEEIDDNAYVLIIVPGFGDATVDGYMPYGRKYGFIKANAELKSYAHELGHGAFGMQHTFPDIPQGSTDNLMDYGSGNHLATFQWDWMRESHWLENILASQSPYVVNQNAFETINLKDIPISDMNTPPAVGFYIPSGKFISVNNTSAPITEVSFDLISGGVYSFRYLGQSYFAVFGTLTDGQNLFLGYFKEGFVERLKNKANEDLASDDYINFNVDEIPIYKNHLLEYLAENKEEVFTDFHWSLTGEQVLGNFIDITQNENSRRCSTTLLQIALDESKSKSDNIVHFLENNLYNSPLEGTPTILSTSDIPLNSNGEYDAYNREPANSSQSPIMDEWFCRLVNVFAKGGWGRYQLEKLLNINDCSYANISNKFNENADLVQLAIIKAEVFEEYGAAFINETQIQYSDLKHDRLVKALLSFNVDYGYTESILNSAENYKNFVQNKFNQLKQNIASLNQKNEQHVVALIIKSMTNVELGLLDVDTRINALKLLAQGTMRGNVNLFGNDEEGNALRIISTAKTEQYASLLHKLKSEKIGDNTLLYELDFHFNDNEFLAGDGNYGQFYRLLIELSYEAYAKNKTAEQLFNTSAKGSILYFGEGSNCYYHTIETAIFTNTSNVNINYQKHCDISGVFQTYYDLYQAYIQEDDEKWFEIEGSFEGQEFSYDPFQNWVIVVPYENNSDLGLTKNEPTMVPAIGLHFLFQENINQQDRLAFRTTLNLVSIVAGGAGLTSSGFTRALALLDLAGTTIDLGTDVFSEELKELIGEDAYNYIRAAAGVMQLSSLGGMGLLKTSKIVNNLPKLSNRFSNLSIDISSLSTKAKNTVTKVLNVFGGRIDDIVDDLSSSWLPGWNKERVLEIPKGSRPDPSEYLEQSYITNHNNKFNEGASYLVPKSSLDNYGRDLIGRPDGQFVMSKSEMDKLLLDANGNKSIIQSELGIPNGLWDNKELVRIDISNPNDLNLRIPNGNEGGANELWLPGGKLPNGRLEAVINQIPAGSYTELILNLE